MKSASAVDAPAEMEGAACDRSHPSPSGGRTSFFSGTRKTSTTSPSCPSSRTASGSQTFSSMSCEYWHQVRGRKGGGGGDKSLLLHLRCPTQTCRTIGEVGLDPNSPLSFFFSSFKMPLFLCVMLQLRTSVSKDPLPGKKKKKPVNEFTLF